MRQSAVAARDQQHSDAELKAMYFDGRHDQTSTGRGGYRATEEHVANVAEPGNEYLSNFTPISGKAIDQANELINVATLANRLRWRGCQYGQIWWNMPTFGAYSRENGPLVCLPAALE